MLIINGKLTQWNVVDVTIGFYNLQFADEGDILRFLEDYIAGPGLGINSKSEIDEIAIFRAGIFCDLLENDLPQLKIIVDHAVENEPFSESELKVIHAHCFPKLKNAKDSATWVIKYDTDLRSEFLRVVYNGILYLCGKNGPGIGRCQYSECERVFSFGGPGSKTKFCSDAHRMRVYRARKNTCDGKEPEPMEYDLFAAMGIGCGLKEYERGKKMLCKWEYNWLDYEQAVRELAKWCEV